MVYTETKPRGPIFIDFTGPGPAYNLPSLIGTDNHDTRSNYSRAPSYTMAGRWKEKKTSNNLPGPIYNPKTTWINEAGGISLKGRHRTRSRDSTGPGPGAYQPNFSWLSENRSGPAYSMAGRHRTRQKHDETPGPNAYVPSFAEHDGKGFSLKGRHKDPKRGDDIPGPLEYKPGSGVIRYGRVTAPEASLKGRNDGAKHSRHALGPGPAAYNPQIDALSSSRSLPSWSLSSRHKEMGTKDRSPGPQTYRPPPPSEVTSAPAYSLQGKRKIRNVADDSPGPGLYNPDPSVGVRGRREQKAASLKGRAREQKKDQSPGPGTYNTDSPRDSGPAYTMAGKWRKREEDVATPGPNKYFPSVLEEGPAYSLKGRHKESDKQVVGPGPGTYNVDKDLDAGPAYSISGKWMTGDITALGDNSPGPGAYFPQQPLRKEDGGISFGVRHSRAKLEPAAIKKLNRTTT
ncbi:hypothetical protein LSH36_800g00042 [Paralvinella palmiformis]|uniref:Uncharacterized protein n=1 Tax=Paralvinella palmiformis TaxID=53620 RepID=A0AAD9IZM1_9ANNE|nr:hypothetical protein LSH36_800g00042 [Paralvinella palmiformis]